MKSHLWARWTITNLRWVRNHNLEFEVTSCNQMKNHSLESKVKSQFGVSCGTAALAYRSYVIETACTWQLEKFGFLKLRMWGFSNWEVGVSQWVFVSLLSTVSHFGIEKHRFLKLRRWGFSIWEFGIFQIENLGFLNLKITRFWRIGVWIVAF